VMFFTRRDGDACHAGDYRCGVGNREWGIVKWE
jgi:hypothetical protein